MKTVSHKLLRKFKKTIKDSWKNPYVRKGSKVLVAALVGALLAFACPSLPPGLESTCRFAVKIIHSLGAP